MDSQQRNAEEAVFNLQTYLRQLSYSHKEIAPPPVDGIFESATRQAVMEFQTLFGLPVTGIADQSTFELLYEEYRNSLELVQKPEPISVFPCFMQHPVLETGSQGFCVAALQWMLQELEYYYSDIGHITPDGDFGEETENAVKVFQRQNGLPPNGEVEVDTWNKITSQFNDLEEYPKS